MRTEKQTPICPMAPLTLRLLDSKNLQSHWKALPKRWRRHRKNRNFPILKRPCLFLNRHNFAWVQEEILGKSSSVCPPPPPQLGVSAAFRLPSSLSSATLVPP